MWIRSQDKKVLTNINSVFIEEPEIMTSFDDAIYVDIVGNGCILGSYETKERALAVLKEIQNCIWDILNGIPQIYQLPEE
jgi:hypothetical protein